LGEGDRVKGSVAAGEWGLQMRLGSGRGSGWEWTLVMNQELSLEGTQGITEEFPV